jgi:hypothetical protein
LARGAAFGGNDKNLHEAWLQIACVVEAIDETIVGRRGIGPIGPRGGRWQIGEVRTFAENERREGEHLSVGRPFDGIGRLIEIGDAGGLSGVHPANIDLLLAIGVGKIGEAGAVGRPARGCVVVVAGGERAVVGAVGINDPQIRIAAVGHGISEASHVGDSFAVGRDLGIGGELDLKFVHHRKFV